MSRVSVERFVAMVDDDMGTGWFEVRNLSYSPEMHVWVRHTLHKPGTRQSYIRHDGFGPTLETALSDLFSKMDAPR